MKETEITVEILDDVNDLINMLKNKNFSLEEEFDMIDYYFSKDETETLKKLEYIDIINHSFFKQYIHFLYLAHIEIRIHCLYLYSEIFFYISVT